MVQKFNGSNFSPHFEVDFNLGNENDPATYLGHSAIVRTLDYLDIDETFDGTYFALLCLNALTGEIHEAAESPILMQDQVISGFDSVPYLTCF